MTATTVMSVALMVLGAVLTVRVLADAPSVTGVVVGLLFVGAGAGRLYVERRP